MTLCLFGWCLEAAVDMWHDVEGHHATLESKCYPTKYHTCSRSTGISWTSFDYGSMMWLAMDGKKRHVPMRYGPTNIKECKRDQEDAIAQLSA